MKHLVLAVALPILAAGAGGCVTDAAQPAASDDPAAATTVPGTPTDPQPQGTVVPGAVPQSCAEVAAALPSGTDGEYVLFIGHQAELHWVAYCADLQSAPREYLTLPHTGNGKNTAMFAAGGTTPGTDVVTAYDKIRVDPISLTIDIGDQSFAHSTGQLTSGSTVVTAMPFGVVATCGGSATANIDLTGTPFHAEDAFPQRGGGTPHWVLSTDQRSLDLSIDGACGWIGPEDLTAQPLDGDGGSVLRLAYQL
jgi:hypothetical protein